MHFCVIPSACFPLKGISQLEDHTLSPEGASAAEWYGVLLSVWSRWWATWEVMAGGNFFLNDFMGRRWKRSNTTVHPKTYWCTGGHRCTAKPYFMHFEPQQFDWDVWKMYHTNCPMRDDLIMVMHKPLIWKRIRLRNHISHMIMLGTKR